MPNLAAAVSKYQGVEPMPLEVRISDAAVEAIVTYLWETSQRNIDENFKWLPPEAKDCGHVLDKSDAWSLGCLVFNLMYCGFVNESDLATVLNTIRGGGEISHETMEVLKRMYPGALIELVKGMVMTDANSRIGIKEASQNDYVQSLMDRYDDRRKLRRQRLEKQLCECNIPSEHGLSTMLHYLVDQLEHENCVEGVLSWIAEMQCCNEASTHPLLPLHVWRIFLVHQDNPTIVQHGFAILAHCTSVGEMRLQAAHSADADGGVEDPTSAEFYDTLIDNSTCWNETSLALVSKLAKRHVDSVQVLVNVLVLLEAILCPLRLTNLELESQLAYWSKCRAIIRKICEMDFPEIITKALMSVHMGHANILRVALAVLWKLSIDHVNARRFVGMHAFKLVYDAMFYFPKHPGIINQGALCLAALVSQRSLKEEAVTSIDVVSLLLNSIHAFCFFSDVCYNLFYAVSAIINRSAELVLRFVRPRLKDCQRGLVALIFKAYSAHRDDNRVLGILTSILQVVMANDGVLEAIINDLPALKALLVEICERFPNIEELGDVARQTLERIPEAFDTIVEEEEVPPTTDSTFLTKT
ncbi:hypothetical protein TcWFU_010438 [Taenia crassiceps]|uniref:Protein kinase domain-containing protein n=1 Tax=Taenia crassiceps TaxID=6207 RepID=A0ABR4QIZ4_9CEST